MYFKEVLVSAMFLAEFLKLRCMKMSNSCRWMKIAVIDLHCSTLFGLDHGSIHAYWFLIKPWGTKNMNALVLIHGSNHA